MKSGCALLGTQIISQLERLGAALRQGGGGGGAGQRAAEDAEAGRAASAAAPAAGGFGAGKARRMSGQGTADSATVGALRYKTLNCLCSCSVQH
jgi:hypothetical protein